jgi:hypothetical protein
MFSVTQIVSVALRAALSGILASRDFLYAASAIATMRMRAFCCLTQLAKSVLTRPSNQTSSGRVSNSKTVNFAMRADSQHFDVVGRIIQAIFVNMVNVLPGQQWSTELLFRSETMFKYPTLCSFNATILDASAFFALPDFGTADR